MTEWRVAATIGATMATAALVVATVHPGIAVFRRIVGRDRCFDEDALNGCATWGNSTLLAGGLVYFGWPHYGSTSLAVVPVLPLVAILFWGMAFTIKATMWRKREFGVNGDVCLSNGEQIHPTFVVRGGVMDMTGPATAYHATVLQLGDKTGTLATNVYIDEDLADADLTAVLNMSGQVPCRQLDLMFVTHVDERTWHTVGLSAAAWTPILCGDLAELTAEDRAWWFRWLQPAFGRDGRATVETSDVHARLERLVAAYPHLEEKHPNDGPDHDRTPFLNAFYGTVRTRDDIRGVRSLLETCDSVDFTTTREHRREIDQVRGEVGGVMHSFDERDFEVQQVQFFGATNGES